MGEDESVLENKDPEIIGTVFSSAIGFIQLYGWFIVFAAIVLLYLRGKVQPWLGSYLHKGSISGYELDADTAQARLEAMERSRIKMQAQLDEKAKKFAKRQKEKDEEKRLQRLDDMEKHSKSCRSKSKAPAPSASSTAAKSKPKKTLKPDYKPLGGSSGGGACYRPARRGARSGGG
jgi:hypothetical protein